MLYDLTAVLPRKVAAANHVSGLHSILVPCCMAAFDVLLFHVVAFVNYCHEQWL